MKRVEWKKRMLAAMAGVMVISAASCGSKTATDTKTTSATTETTSETVSKSVSEAVTETTAAAAGPTFETVNTDAVKLIALGNSDVPVGQYSQKVFEHLGTWDQIQSKISFGTNVKEVLSQVEEKSVDCGVVYATDAVTATGIKVVETAPEDWAGPVVYPVAVLKNSKSQEAAKVFENYLLSDEAVAEFTKAGFEMNIQDKAEDMTYDGAEATLNVFAAASMTESLNTLQTAFEQKYPKIKLVFNFDSSGTLQTQIEQGAAADVFISAADKQMTALKGESLVVDDTIKELLKNHLVMIVPAE